MFTLITGLPGASKTLNCIDLVERERIVKHDDGTETKRPVFYWGIPELKLDWQPLHAPDSSPEDARKRYDSPPNTRPDDGGPRPQDAWHWYECPTGSIIVIDECQEVFRKLSQKEAANLPEYFKRLATHRHSGFDLVCMSQKPRLIDIAARAQVQRHWHFERPFGLDYANRMEWENKVANVDERSDRNQASTTRVPLAKKWFGMYRSADVHNVKKRLPYKKIAILAGSIIGAIALISFAFVKVRKLAAPHVPQQTAEALETGKQGKNQSVVDWGAESFRARVPGWLWSAPFYDLVAKAQSYPRITGCMEINYGDRVECRCSNGQGDADVDMLVCHQYMRGRIFDPSRPPEDVKAENIRRLDAAQSGGGASYSESSPEFQSPRNSAS